MNVILSWKGMDSRSGGIPSPILPDGTLLSFPIPDGTSGKPYAALTYKGQSLQKIIHQVSPRFDFIKNETCHLDPDIYNAWAAEGAVGNRLMGSVTPLPRTWTRWALGLVMCSCFMECTARRSTERMARCNIPVALPSCISSMAI